MACPSVRVHSKRIRRRGGLLRVRAGAEGPLKPEQKQDLPGRVSIVIEF
ncbi:hypothetical protein D187_001461 [Cystobacter fuscus DSM 2262]|uniref:Uncharacterized protein n=1 Tax=Cystobacter fuscus (strain ATCC 25194 / DSM 2262 / NBRC 100088 / M29) TaxID=1242864 RepID=S9PEL8_CYSF2|nr:hypothetical protein D187_001461 [Cystobacter fuscus DSM 2262]